MSNTATLKVLKHHFINRKGAQVEFNITLDGVFLNNFNTVHDEMGIEECCKTAETYVQAIRKKLNLYVAVELHRDVKMNTPI